jgi:hypothetical protein
MSVAEGFRCICFFAGSPLKFVLTSVECFRYRKSVTIIAHRHHPHHVHSALAEVFG